MAVELNEANQVFYFSRIPVVLTENAIYSRLGRNRFLNRMPDVQRNLLEKYIEEGIALCKPQGCWTRLNIVERTSDSATLENGSILHSARLAEMLSASHAVLLTAATASARIGDAAGAAAEAGEGVKALVYDAAGSEISDGAIGWIHEYAAQLFRRNGERLTTRRFSPGYGDLGLENQKIIFNILKLDKIGVRLNENLIMIPEKSVTAISGIEK
ncbi:MAG: methionine synthase [Victivallaceae bacterium]